MMKFIQGIHLLVFAFHASNNSIRKGGEAFFANRISAERAPFHIQCVGMITTVDDSFFVSNKFFWHCSKIIFTFAVLAKKIPCLQSFQVIMDRVSPGIELPGNFGNTEGFSGIIAEKLFDLNPEIILALHGKNNASRTLLILVQILT